MFYFRTNVSQEVPFHNYKTPIIDNINKKNQISKDLTSTLIDSNINQMSMSNYMKPTTSSLFQSKSMGFENKSFSSENYSGTSQSKPMSLQSSSNNWNDLWTKPEETQQVKKLSLSDINDLLS